uniref:Uncharacterized protein n=1 Tax=Nelumbo nucifera TaxID=4432 RepID=A0A822YVT5_NELNU|nr:TPA_asm: hypothetical protein HUJ06_005865 [Nelumbo nucifera]
MSFRHHSRTTRTLSKVFIELVNVGCDTAMINTTH